MSHRTTIAIAIALAPLCVVASAVVLASAGLTSLAVLALGMALFAVDGATPDGAYLDGMGGSAPTVVDVVPSDALPVRIGADRALVMVRASVDVSALAQAEAEADAWLAEVSRLDAAIARASASRHRARAASYQARRDAAWQAYRAALRSAPASV